MSGPAGMYAGLPTSIAIGDDDQNLLSDVPLKLDMTRPENQARARAAWAKYRAQLGQPVPVPKKFSDLSDDDEKVFQATENHARLGKAIEKKYLGWPLEAVHAQQMRDQGVPDGYSSLTMGSPPADAFNMKAHNASAVTIPRDPRTGELLRKIPNPSPPLASSIFLPPDRDGMKEFDYGNAVHEGVHSWAMFNNPNFRVAGGSHQADPSRLNVIGEEPAPHFPGGFHDRGMVDAAEAENLAMRFGGYPKDVQPAPTWPKMGGTSAGKYPRFGSTPAPESLYAPAIDPSMGDYRN